jgi:hypothetical protein
MGLSTFLKFYNTLKENGFLKSSRYVKITEQVATFLLVVTQGHSHRDVSDRKIIFGNNKPILSPNFKSALQS